MAPLQRSVDEDMEFSPLVLKLTASEEEEQETLEPVLLKVLQTITFTV